PAPGGGVAAAGPSLRYRWEGGPHVYSVRIEGDKGEVLETHQGTCIVRAGRADPMAGPGSPQPRPGARTGGVGHADVLLLTCAHVVADANKIEVKRAGQKCLATVDAVEHETDLALLRITAQNLPTLPLANSDTAAVGQEVRALGFPLSNLLGESMK